MRDDSTVEDIERKIIRDDLTFHAKGFSIDEMKSVDEYCKKIYGNNRKLMIFDLIRYKDDNTAVTILNDKINFIYDDINKRLEAIEPSGKPVEKPKNTSWNTDNWGK